jgi:hypothetical protein
MSPLATRRRTALLILGSALLASCAGPELSDYSGQKPAFNFRQYFDGPLVAHGMVTDRSGQVIRRFTVQMQCQWQGDVGTLDEQFLYDDGERQHRVWRVQQQTDGRMAGTAPDVVGQARGQASGSAFNWQYTLALPVKGSVYEVQFDDWMHRIDERTVLNRAVMSKFGLRVGEVLLSFNRPA